MEVHEFLLVFLEPLLERREVVVDHHAVDYELLLGLEFEDAGHCEIQGHSLHEALQDVQRDLDQVDLVDEYLLHLAAVDEGEVLIARVLSHILLHDAHVLGGCGREGLQELVIDYLQLLEGNVFEGE